MLVSSIQGNSFQGVNTATHFNPTPHQKEMIKTIKDNFVNDTVIYRKGKNFLNFMESKGYHILLSNGDYKDEIKVEIGSKSSEYSMKPDQNCGSFPESRLNNVVYQAKEKWKEHTINNILFATLAVAYIAFLIATANAGRK